MVQSSSLGSVLYVHPVAGNDGAAGSQTAPLRTIQRAMQLAKPGWTVQLAAGIYSAASGEVFPVTVLSGVRLLGDETKKGNSVVIEGSGDWSSPQFSRQAIALRLEPQTELRGITVRNPAPQGTGVWLETGIATIVACTFQGSTREGVLAAGTANLLLTDCLFSQNGSQGLTLVRNAKGEVRRNTFHNTGFGITIADQAAPLVAENQFEGNKAGVALLGSVRPVLRANRFENNIGDGVLITQTAQPDLGIDQDGGSNWFRNNQGFDINLATGQKIVAIGNQFTAAKLNGNVDIGATSIAAPPSGSSPSQFADVAGHWAASFIENLVSRNILTGFPDGTFRPDAMLSRAQFAAAITRAFSLPTRRPASTFADVPPNFWAAKAIQQAEQMGFLSGFPDYTFRPNQNLTRVQAIVALVSGLGLTGGSSAALAIYRDRAAIPSFALDRVATATQRQMVVNYPLPEQLEPLREITRAEVAALLYQSFVALGRAAALTSPYIVQPIVSGNTFSDLVGHWATDFINALNSQSLINGFPDGTFRPEAPLTRAQFAGLVVRTFNPVPRRPAVAFKDIPATFWAMSAIQRAYQGGFISGFADQTFRPDLNVSRVQVIVAIVNGLGFGAADPAILGVYSDRATIPSYAQVAVAVATQNRLVVNHPVPRFLNPNLQATRAEVAATVYQALVRLGRMPAIASDYIVSP